MFLYNNKGLGVIAMKTIKFFLLAAIILNVNLSVFAQEITVVPQDTLIEGSIGDEMIFYIDVTNISGVEQTVFVVRTINDLPLDWNSALCFDVCFLSEFDSVATTPYFGSSPLSPGETREMSLHVTAVNNDGTAHVQLQAGTFSNPNNRITTNFTATTLPVSVNSENHSPTEYYLAQNYPNPFNPSTNIKFGLREAGFVSLKIYDVLGNEVADLVNEHKPAGNFEVNFESNHLSSGIYIYRLVTNNFSETRKMILEK